VGRPLSNCDGIERRQLLLALAASLLTGPVSAQSTSPVATVRRFNNVVIAVSDLPRSIGFYQKLFGPPVAAPDGAIFHVGDGGQFFLLIQAGAKAETVSYGLAVEDFAADRLARMLADRGVTGAEITMRGGAAALSLNDPNGVRMELQDDRYPQGWRGSSFDTGRPAFALRTINHVTLNTTEGAKSLAFYRDIFGLVIQARQGPTVTMGMGSTRQSVVFNTAANAGGIGGINHVCFTIRNFDPARAMGVLIDNGLEPIEFGSPVKPLTARVRLRQRAAGGGGPTSPMGTAELYFTDPDNIAIQLQDERYCGGSGWLGEICS